MADKGVFDPARIGGASSSVRGGAAGNDDGKNTGGWSEVAKKSRDTVVKEDEVAGANFKVVASKKKGGRR